MALDDGNRLDYDKLLIATGSQPRLLTVPGADSQRLYYLRILEDSEQLGARLRAGTRVVMVGGGWIGLEVAAVAADQGCQVTIVDPHAVSLESTLGASVGGFFADVHRDHGVDFLFGARVVKLVDGVDATRVELDDGRRLSADCVAVGIGAIPQAQLVDSALLADDGGISVDVQMRTADRRVFAAGDVATVMNPFYEAPVRSEHWANALMGGQIAARSILDVDSMFDPLPFFFTDQYDLFMEYAGWLPPGTSANAVIRGDPQQRAFQAFWLADERVVAAMHVNRREEGMVPLQTLIRARTRVDPERLSDPSIPLADVAPQRRRDNGASDALRRT